MYFQEDMCCLCLNRNRVSSEKLHNLKDIGDVPDVSYYEKINLSLSKLEFKNEYAQDYMLCVKCCSIIDNIYEFNNSSIRNIDIMTQYMTLLSSPSNQRCNLVVELSDCCDAVINNKECIKLEDTITSEETVAIVHNTVAVCETTEDNGDIILHWSDDAYLSTVKMVNNVKVENNVINVNKVVTHVTDSCVDNINIKEVLNIKIEEPEVVDNYRKHAIELSDINNIHIYNRSFNNLEGGTTGVTDVEVHDNVPVSDSSQDNDGVILNQLDDYLVCTGEVVNDVEDSYSHRGVEEAYIVTDGTPGSVADPLNTAIDASGHEPVGNEPYVCEVCKKEFILNNDIIRHKCVHTGEKPYTREVSNKVYIQSRKLVGHKRSHTDEKPYVCKVCYKGFSRNDTLIKHKRIHTGEKPYVCEVCNKGFKRNEHLIRHKRIHTGEKPYMCEVCNSGFTASDKLITHKRIHTGEKPYVCEVCYKGFANSGNLFKHKRIHTGKKPYVCEVCNKGFNQNESLTVHKRIHTGKKPYVYEVCNKGFNQTENLTIHKRINTGEKPYVCEVCNKGFTNRGNLIKHKRMHTGEKPYVCEVCNKGFNQNGNLTVHKRIHTGLIYEAI